MEVCVDILKKYINKINLNKFKNSRIIISSVCICLILGLSAISLGGGSSWGEAQNEDVAFVENREVIEVKIPFEEQKRTSSALNTGESLVAREGEDGIRRETYEVIYDESGVKTGKTLISSEVIKEPVNKITEQGTGNIVLASRSGADTSRYGREITMTATAYCACKKCTGSGNAVTATGLTAKYGVVAVDPKVIPLGSRVYVEGGGYVYGAAIAADTGGAIRGNKIDLCFNTHAEALAFGRRTVKVRVE
jgi:3D (Asp-Asp-Asp) domain-containing protein